MPVVSPYLGKAITIEQMLSKRATNYEERDKFCVAFIGKAYPFRMQAIAALSQIGKVDVYGGIARNENSQAARFKYETSQRYKFVFPGYVTEKAPEAWATGAIPLYWGIDSQGCFNEKSLINLANFNSLEDFISKVAEVNASHALWSAIAEEPLLTRRPDLSKVFSVLQRALSPLTIDMV
jgi:hypothetical protein